MASDGENKPVSAWMTMNMFSGETAPPAAQSPAGTESTGLAGGFFNKIKNKFMGAGESIRNTATNLYEKNYKYFAIAFGCGILLIILSLFFLPLAVISPQKFSLLFSLGSICILSSFAFLQNPYDYFMSLFSGEKLIFSVCYIGSLLLSIYASLIIKNYILTIIVTFIQVLA